MHLGYRSVKRGRGREIRHRRLENRQLEKVSAANGRVVDAEGRAHGGAQRFHPFARRRSKPTDLTESPPKMPQDPPSLPSEKNWRKIIRHHSSMTATAGIQSSAATNNGKHPNYTRKKLIYN
jgi:hypothetical protein